MKLVSKGGCVGWAVRIMIWSSVFVLGLSTGGGRPSWSSPSPSPIKVGLYLLLYLFIRRRTFIQFLVWEDLLPHLILLLEESEEEEYSDKGDLLQESQDVISNLLQALKPDINPFEAC